MGALLHVCVCIRSRGRNGLHRDVTLDGVMQLDADGVLADGLDRLADLDGPLVEGGATSLLDGQGDVGR